MSWELERYQNVDPVSVLCTEVLREKDLVAVPSPLQAMSLRRSTRSAGRLALEVGSRAKSPPQDGHREVPLGDAAIRKKRRMSSDGKEGAERQDLISAPLIDPRTVPQATASDLKAQAKHSQLSLTNFRQVGDPGFIEQHRVQGLSGGDCFFVEKMVAESEANGWYAELTGLKEWFRPTLTIYGRSVLQSRLICAYSSEPGKTLTYSNATIPLVSPFPPLVNEIGKRVGAVLGGERGPPIEFNHCMLNWYEDGSVHIGKHSDNLENLVIASLSLGAPRTLLLHPRMPHKTRGGRASGDLATDDTDLASREVHRLPLPNGSLFVMQGRTQEYWKHEIPKEPKIKQGRISLTFRQLIDKPAKSLPRSKRKAADDAGEA